MKNLKIIFWTIIIAIFVVLFYYNWFNQTEMPKILELKINETILKAEIADTPIKQEKGLSGKMELNDDQAMLFIFSKLGYYNFWMKDMNFPIDIAWLDENKKIIHIENAVSPATYPKSFNSSRPSLYVLETSANFFMEHKIKIGDLVNF